MNDPLTKSNDDYWADICGSRAARKIGIVPADPDGVARFDEWFFTYYPYIADESIIPWSSIGNFDVLEIGIGYGSMSRRLAETCRQLIGCDVSRPPTAFVRRTSQKVIAVQGSAHALPLQDESVDVVVSLGCLHHTGALRQSIDECIRVLRPNGRLILMVYNAYSYKQWILSPLGTTRRLVQERRGRLTSMSRRSNDRVARFYDRNGRGEAPPFTEFVSRTQIRAMLSEMRRVRTFLMNLDNLGDLLPPVLQSTRIDRIRIASLRLPILKWCGLDLYVIAEKGGGQ